MLNLNELFSLKGEVAMVTGGNSGIGKAMVEGLASAGADIVIAARDEAKTARVIKEFEDGYKNRFLGVKMDVSNEGSVQEGVKQAFEKFGKITILINNAGTNFRRMAQDYTVEEWDSIMNVNLRGAFICSKAVYPIMKANGGGKIINTGSITSLLGNPKTLVYACSKTGILSLTYSLALAWVNDNIRVNAILPGWIDTPLTRNLRSKVPNVDRFIKERVPMGRWGKPADLMGATIFLASHASDFITAEFIRVDGGFAQGTINMEPYNQHQA
jgi:2-deoxy-D-gluconate 3-dehydrogenase